jgi:protein-disulfide isomerase
MKIILPVGLVIAFVVGGAVGWFSALKKVRGDSASSVAGSNEDPTTAPVFSLDDKVYVMGDLPVEMRNTLIESQVSAFERAQATVKEFALRVTKAKEKDPTVTTDKLPPLQDLLTSTPPTDDEIKKFFEENKERLPPNVSFDQVKGQLAQFMVRQKMMDVMQKELAKLEEAGRLKMLMPEPASPEVNLDLAGFPAQGPEKSATVLVEASDYLCPHCREVQTEVASLLKDMGDKIRFVQVNFALHPDGLSGALARGAFCAYKQSADIFWKYHELAFKVSQDEAAKNDKENDKVIVASVGKEAGADPEKFAACVDSTEAVTYVQTSVSKMSQAGVTGTPTFFLNNKKLSVHGRPLKEIVRGAVAGG